MPSDIPLWVSILEAANGDPLRAQELEETLTKDWWLKYKAYSRVATQVMKAAERKAKHG